MSDLNYKKLHRIIDDTSKKARSKNIEYLTEDEGQTILTELGIKTPRGIFVKTEDEIPALDFDYLPGEKVVVKIVSPKIIHKNKVRGVVIVKNTFEEVKDAIKDMRQRLSQFPIDGFLIQEYIEYDHSLGNELLIGMKYTHAFGTIVSLGLGGINAEFLTSKCGFGGKTVIFPACLPDEKTIKKRIANIPFFMGDSSDIKGKKYGQDLVDLIEKFSAFARQYMPSFVSEFEINPLVLTQQGIVALDVLIRLGKKEKILQKTERPLYKMKHLLEPESIAIIGVSEKMNPGHIILNNLIKGGFDKKRLYIIKPDYTKTIEGCLCYKDIPSLPEKVDLMIIGVKAQHIPAIVQEVIDLQKAESLILITSGLEEKNSGNALVANIYQQLEKVRSAPWRGPLIHGSNCVGIKSDFYNSMFIPEYKMQGRKKTKSPLAIISQSGAFLLSKMNKLDSLNPKFAISVGNQMDLTISDYLRYLKEDPEIEVYGIYGEGFRFLDGVSFLKSVQEITNSGKTVIFYPAGGRSEEAAKASASHTASIATDFVITKALAEDAGAIVVDSFEDFEDLILLFTLLKGKKVNGNGIAAISNAGAEVVCCADHKGFFYFPDFTDETKEELVHIFTDNDIHTLVDLHNPLDVTPRANDDVYGLCSRALIDDPNIDLLLVGIVPFTPSLKTLDQNPTNPESFLDKGSVAMHLEKLQRETTKPLVCVVDGGRPFDPMVEYLTNASIPTFRTADRAIRLFNTFCYKRLNGNDHSINV